MRDELASTANEPPARITPGLHAERHYCPSELAELWGLRAIRFDDSSRMNLALSPSGSATLGAKGDM